MAKVASSDDSSLVPLEEMAVPWTVAANQAKNSQGQRLRCSLGVSYSMFIVFPDDPQVQLWGGFMGLLMLYTVLITPYRIAFVDTDTVGWVAIDGSIDGLFFIDLILNSITAYYDEEKNVVTSHWKIFARYAKSWLFLDLLACLPLQYIFSESANYNNLLRLSRLPRIYRLVRMFRIMRMMKVVKNRASIMRFMTQVFRISLSMERLFWFCVTLMFILHLTTCAWVFIGKFTMDSDPENWIFEGSFVEEDNVGLYIIGLYWTITTVATVGYGDIHSENLVEMCVNSIVMLIGVFVYSYMIGSLTNLISSLDTRKAKLNQKLELLVQLSKEFTLSKGFYTKLTNAIEYEHNNTNQELDDLIDSLPSSLRNDLLIVIYERKIENNAFFEGRSNSFVAWVAPQLKPARFIEEEFVYREGDLATEMYFIVQGDVDFVLHKGREYVCYLGVSSNYYFGEIELIFSETKLRFHTTRVHSKTEALCLREDHLERLLKTFEAEALELLALSQQRFERINERRQTAEVEYEARKAVIRHLSIPLKPEERKKKAKEFKEELEGKASRVTEDDVAYLKSDSQMNVTRSFSQNVTDSVGDFQALAGKFQRKNSRMPSFVKKPIVEKFKKKVLKRHKPAIGDIERQMKALGRSVEEMRGTVVQLCLKFNLPQALLPSDNPLAKLPRRTKGGRRSSWQVPSYSILESESEEEGEEQLE